MRCSVVFRVTLRLLVINISSSSPTINTAAYYQRCAITCETVAVHRRPHLQHLPVAALTQAVKPDIWSESRFRPTPPTFDASVKGFPSENCYAVWSWKTRIGSFAWLPGGEKILKICLFIFTQFTNVTDTQTDTAWAAWRHRPRLCIASCGK